MSEALFRLFPFGLLFRGIFAGAFFVLAFVVGWKGWTEDSFCFVKANLTVLAFLATISGVVVYTLFRGVLYPWIEYGLDYNQQCRLSACCCLPRLISLKTRVRLRKQWKLADENKSLAQHLATWGDYVQFQYVSALCIAAGAVIGRSFHDRPELVKLDYTLLAAFLALFISALVGDVRGRAVVESELTKEKDDNETPPLVVTF